MKTLGRHLLIELYGCEPDALDDLARVRSAMLEAAVAVGAEKVGESFHPFTPQGISGTVVIAESHLSIHTWPEHGYAAVDVYTCGGLDPRPGIAVLKRALVADEVRTEEILRGLPDELDAHAQLRPSDVRVLAGEFGFPAPDGGAPASRIGLDRAAGWFSEGTVPGTRQGNITHGFRMTRVVCQRTTPYQELAIFDSPVYGRVVVLDGIVQLSTADEAVYHELLVHPAMLAHPAPRRVLIVGGGDGGTLREVLRHDPDEVVMIDIDREVVALCAEHLPTLSDGAFADPRLTLLHMDASQVIADYADHFDVAIINSNNGNDAIGPSTPLFGAPFYAKVARALRPDGICSVQGGSFLDPEFLELTRDNIAEQLPQVVVRRLTVPCYHCGEYGFLVATRRCSAAGPGADVLAARLAERGFGPVLKHYSPQVHHASLVYPPSSRFAR